MTRTECERYIEEEREREKGLDFSLARYIYHPSLSALTSQQRYQRVVNNLTQPMFYADGSTLIALLAVFFFFFIGKSFLSALSNDRIMQALFQGITHGRGCIVREREK